MIFAIFPDNYTQHLLLDNLDSFRVFGYKVASRVLHSNGTHMFIIANLLDTLAAILSFVLTAYMYIIIARAILSWVNPDPYNPIVNFLYRATEPVLQRIRNILPDVGPIDLSPIVVFVIIMFLQKFVVRTIGMLAMKIGG